MAKKKLEKISTGIWRDAHGILIRVANKDTRSDAAGVRYCEGPYLNKDGSPNVRKLEIERHRIMGNAGIVALKEAEKATGFAADVATFVGTFPSGSKRQKDVAGSMEHWIAVFGDRPRVSITSLEIKQQMAKWSRKCDSTRFHWRQVLNQMWRTLDGKTAPNPVADVPVIKPRYDAPRAVPYTLIEEILTEMGDTDSAVRARLMAYTGLPQAQIRRIHPSMVDLTNWTYQVKARRKGNGAPAKTFPMHLKETRAAWTAFATRPAVRKRKHVGCWGGFACSNFAKQWGAAAEAVQTRWLQEGKPWPVDFDPRAYDLRHSFLTEVMRVTGDLYAVNELAQHSTLEQTKRYLQGVASPRVDAALKQAQGQRMFARKRIGRAADKASARPSHGRKKSGALPITTKGRGVKHPN